MAISGFIKKLNENLFGSKSSQEDDKTKLNRMPSPEAYLAKFGEYKFDKYDVIAYDQVSWLNYSLNVLGKEPTAEQCYNVGLSFVLGLLGAKIDHKIANYWFNLALELGYDKEKVYLFLR